jgi:hypothetical protein
MTDEIQDPETSQEETSQEEASQKEAYVNQMKDDLRWLSLVCPQVPDPKEIEIAAQTLGLLQAVNPFLKNMEKSDIMLLSLVGYIASKARQADAERFNKVSPYTYLHLAYAWRGAKDDEKEYAKFIHRISGG